MHPPLPFPVGTDNYRERKNVLFRFSWDLPSSLFPEDPDSMVSDEEGLYSVGACVRRGGSACAVGLSEAHAEEDRRLLRVDQVCSLRLKSAARDPTAGSTDIPRNAGSKL